MHFHLFPLSTSRHPPPPLRFLSRSLSLCSLSPNRRQGQPGQHGQDCSQPAAAAQARLGRSRGQPCDRCAGKAGAAARARQQAERPGQRRAKIRLRTRRWVARQKDDRAGRAGSGGPPGSGDVSTRRRSCGGGGRAVRRKPRRRRHRRVRQKRNKKTRVIDGTHERVQEGG
jgi:hypothetical protein